MLRVWRKCTEQNVLLPVFYLHENMIILKLFAHLRGRAIYPLKPPICAAAVIAEQRLQCLSSGKISCLISRTLEESSDTKDGAR